MKYQGWLLIIFIQPSCKFDNVNTPAKVFQGNTQKVQMKTRPSKHSSWWRHLEDAFRLRLQKTSSRRLQDVLIKTNIFALALRLHKASWSRPIYLSWLYVFKASSKRLQDIFKTFWRRLQNVFKTSSRRPVEISSRRFQGVPSG